MGGSISHKGKIVSIDSRVTRVDIISESACAGCHARTLCGLSENVTKTVEVATDPFGRYNVGEEVNVLLSRTMGHKAVWISYVIPLLILVALVLILTRALESELVAGVCAIAGAGAWYLAVWLLRGSLADSFAFTVEKLK